LSTAPSNPGAAGPCLRRPLAGRSRRRPADL